MVLANQIEVMLIVSLHIPHEFEVIQITPQPLVNGYIVYYSMICHETSDLTSMKPKKCYTK